MLDSCWEWAAVAPAAPHSMGDLEYILLLQQQLQGWGLPWPFGHSGLFYKKGFIPKTTLGDNFQLSSKLGEICLHQFSICNLCNNCSDNLQPYYIIVVWL